MITSIAGITNTSIGTSLTVAGWVRTFRNDRFIVLSDGTSAETLQCVIDRDLIDPETKSRLTTGASIMCSGTIVESQGEGQSFELKVASLEVIGDCAPSQLPIQPKSHSLEFMRENAHLRFRSNIYGCIFRMRSEVSFAINRFLHSNNYTLIHTPIITTNDAEGAGEMFRATTLEAGRSDFSEDFFGAESHLTVSGQLHAEMAMMRLGKVYTFGPTFRAENSNTTRHLAEFWMVEPETAFLDINGNMDLAEELCERLMMAINFYNMSDLIVLDKRFADEERSKPESQRSGMGLIRSSRIPIGL